MAFNDPKLVFGDRTFKIEVKFFTKKTDQFIREVKEATLPVLQATADHIAREASTRAPIQSPPDDPIVLKESIEGKAWGKRSKNIGFRVRTRTRGGEKTPPGRGYGGFPEFGTSKQEAQPFLYPSFENGIRQLIRSLRNIL